MIALIGGKITDVINMREYQGDILILDNKIVAIKEINDSYIVSNSPKHIHIRGRELLDYSGLCDNKDELLCYDVRGYYVSSGLIDGHVHFRDPGQTYKEDINTGAMSAKAGGYTTVVMMANTVPVIDNVDSVKYAINKGSRTDIRVETAATVSIGMKGIECVDFLALQNAGAVCFTDDGLPLMNELVLRSALMYSKESGIPISLHEEDPDMVIESGYNRGYISDELGILGASREAEISMIARDLELALKTEGIINIQHISTKEGVNLVRLAKEKEKILYGRSGNSSRIHAEATPHHFALTEGAVLMYGTCAKMNPPLREEADRLAIIQGLTDGTIDCIVTDHAPHSIEDKSKGITKAPSGLIGLETALSIGIMELVCKGYLTICELMCRMSYGPAIMFGWDRGYIGVGAIADIVIFDVDEEWVPEAFQSKSSNTPFKDWILKGRVKMTICDGVVVYEHKN